MNGPEAPKKSSASAIVIAVIASVIIVALAGAYYYSIVYLPAFNPELADAGNVEETASVQQPAEVLPAPEPEPQEPSTSIITFAVPAILPATEKDGYCWVNSAAQPYRADAWRCMVENSIYDPCFIVPSIDSISKVFCQMDPLAPDAFLINLTKPLPEPSLPQDLPDNWAWFLEFEDGTVCAPYTGTRPFINGKTAYYGCRSGVKNETAVLTGDLKKGTMWAAEKSVLVKNGAIWTVKSSEQANIKTVWQ